MHARAPVTYRNWMYIRGRETVNNIIYIITCDFGNNILNSNPLISFKLLLHTAITKHWIETWCSVVAKQFFFNQAAFFLITKHFSTIIILLTLYTNRLTHSLNIPCYINWNSVGKSFSGDEFLWNKFMRVKKDLGYPRSV